MKDYKFAEYLEERINNFDGDRFAALCVEGDPHKQTIVVHDETDDVGLKIEITEV